MKCVEITLNTHNCNIKRRLSEIVTCDETWIHYIEPQKKIDDKMCSTKKAKHSDIAKRCQSKKKVFDAVFFSSEGSVLQVAILKGRSITEHVCKNMY